MEDHDGFQSLSHAKTMATQLQSKPKLLTNLLVRVRMLCLPIEYFEHSFLMRLGSKIGNPIKVDDATSLVTRGHYARICGEVDLMKSLGV